MADERVRHDDHDLLIRIENTVERLERDLRDLRDGVLRDVMKLDTRVRVIEDLALKADPIIAHGRYDAWGREWEAFRNRTKGMYAALAFLFVTLTGVVLTLVNLYEKLRAFGAR